MVCLSTEYTYEELTHIILVFMKALRFKDAYTFAHSERVGFYAAEIARKMNLPEEEIEATYLLGRLHDIGKLFVPDHILQKPASLDEAEWFVMKKHAHDAVRILSCMGVHADHLHTVGCLHERFDGTGYPSGIAGTRIPVAARIIAVADSYDAMMTDRPYRKAQTVEYVCSEFSAERARQFCPDVVDATLEMIAQRALPKFPM